MRALCAKRERQSEGSVPRRWGGRCRFSSPGMGMTGSLGLFFFYFVSYMCAALPYSPVLFLYIRKLPCVLGRVKTAHGATMWKNLFGAMKAGCQDLFHLADSHTQYTHAKYIHVYLFLFCLLTVLCASEDTLMQHRTTWHLFSSFRALLILAVLALCHFVLLSVVVRCWFATKGDKLEDSRPLQNLHGVGVCDGANVYSTPLPFPRRFCFGLCKTLSCPTVKISLPSLLLQLEWFGVRGPNCQLELKTEAPQNLREPYSLSPLRF